MPSLWTVPVPGLPASTSSRSFIVILSILPSGSSSYTSNDPLRDRSPHQFPLLLQQNRHIAMLHVLIRQRNGQHMLPEISAPRTKSQHLLAIAAAAHILFHRHEQVVCFFGQFFNSISSSMGFTNRALIKRAVISHALSAYHAPPPPSSPCCPRAKSAISDLFSRSTHSCHIQSAPGTPASRHRPLLSDNVAQSDASKSTAYFSISDSSHLFFGAIMVIFGISGQIRQIKNSLMGLPVAAHQVLHGQSQIPPADSEYRHHGGSDRRRAAGKMNTRQRSASSLLPPALPQMSPHAASAIPTSKKRSGNILWKRFNPVPSGHRRRDCHHVLISVAQLSHHRGKNIRYNLPLSA